MTETAILLENVHKHYGKVHALRGLDLEVNKGEIFGFLGPNGAGKTTTIRCMLDLIRPNSGSIHVLGMDPQKTPQKVKANVGYLPGDLKLEGGFTPRRFLKQVRRLRGNNRPWEDVKAIAERLDLSLDTRIKALSHGNKQKVGFLQCFVSDVPLLMLDEPTLGLDPLMQQKVLRIIKEESEKGTTVFFSSHILSEVQKIADRVGIIRKGELVEVAQTDDLINRALTRVAVQFESAVPEPSFRLLENVEVLRVNDKQRSYSLEVKGAVDSLVKKLAEYPVRDIEVNKPSLEEVFLNYYQDEGEEG